MRIGRRGLLEGLGLVAFARRALADETLLRFGASPQNLATPTSNFERLITPVESFFVRSHFGAPALERKRALDVGGLVKSPVTLTADALRDQFKETTVTAVLQCAGNGRALHRPRVPGIQWVHGAMGQATFTGVRLKDVLQKAGVLPDAGHLRLAGADGPPKPTVPAFVRSIPLSRALDPSTLIAWGMNGQPLTLAHGAPLRLVVPGWAGDHWVKWLTSIRVQKEEAEGFYMQTAYRMPIERVEPGAAVPPDKMKPATTFPIKSIIGAPADGAKGKVGAQKIAGVAFSGDAKVLQVEVSVDGGATWTKAKLEGEPGAGRWQVFRAEIDVKTRGPVKALARATDTKGNVQPKDAVWNPSGYYWNGWHEVTWTVE
jgi:DMSO/TMAO reductase YedYZ molybdopterin-dependent catalytic subunit